jgi:hypothetical protein
LDKYRLIRNVHERTEIPLRRCGGGSHKFFFDRFATLYDKKRDPLMLW